MAKSKPIPKDLPRFDPKGRRRARKTRQYEEPIGPAPIPKAEKSKGGGFRKAGMVAGLGALATLGGVVGTKLGMRAAKVDESSLLMQALADIQAQERDSKLAEVTRVAQAESYEDSIQRNLRSIQRYAPELYMQVAAGRRLPQGAVVLGGAARQDLLNELGRAMADGRFSR